MSASSFSCRYRFLLADPQPWKELAWSNVVEQSHGAQAAGILDLNSGKRFPLTMHVRHCETNLVGRQFFGFGIRLAAESTNDFPVEIELVLPMAEGDWHYYVQDLYTRQKAGEARRLPAVASYSNWQAKRSPVDFAAGSHGVFVARLDSLAQMFSSGAEFTPGKGLTLRYKFTCPSATQWRTPELSMLLCGARLDVAEQKDLWCEIFLQESQRFRVQAGIQREEVLPMANIPVDGGTPGCAPRDQLKVRGTFDEFAEETLSLCAKLNYRRVLIGSPWISYRTEGMTVKAMSTVTYDSRCGTIEVEVSPRYGGRPALRRFCDAAHARNIEVFAWYPAFHLANCSRHLSEHPEWIIRKADGSPFTMSYFHITAISPRQEAQQHFLAKLKEVKEACGLDGLWLDSYNDMPFLTLDYSREQGVEHCRAGIEMVKRFQQIGLRVINEGYSPFGARGDGETTFFKGQEDMAVETTLFTYWTNLGKVLENDGYFRFLANKAPLTLPAPYLAAEVRPMIARWNAAFNRVVPFMQHRRLLPNDQGVLWSDGAEVAILFAYQDGEVEVGKRDLAHDLVEGQRITVRDGHLAVRRSHIYEISKKAE
ncbi:MAG: hypothetical protein NT105_19980 [Verrucomicrobia bacterium]|nr:hypothetical protein [Verrucomicrobiota bacterium]